MINNQDGTFTWQDGDIITAEKMNKLLSEDDCGIKFLQVKVKEGEQSSQAYYYIEASYNDLKEWMEENKIICIIKKDNDIDLQYQSSEYSLLRQLIQLNDSDINYTAKFMNNDSFESSDPNTNLIKAGGIE